MSLALGTGANAAVCGVVYRLLLSAPDGVRDAGELVAVYTSEFSGAPYGRTSFPDFTAIAQAAPFARAAAYDDSTFENVSLAPETPHGGIPGSGAVQRVRIVKVTDAFFDTLRMRASAGRLLDTTDADSQPRSAVVSAAIAELLDSPGTIVGRTIQAGAESFRIVGVAPRRFRGLHTGRPADVWLPMGRSVSDDRGDRRLAVIARRAGALDDVGKSLAALTAQLADRYPDTNRGAVVDPGAPRQIVAIGYSPLDPAAKSEATIVAAVVIGAVVLLLAGACVNAGTLLLSRAMARRREVAVKMALGAGRATLVRQLLLESLMISVAGGALGLLFANWTMSAIPALFSPDHAELLDTGIDTLLVLLTVGVATAAGAVFGIAPAIQGTGAPATLALRADSGGISEQHGGAWMRSVLITGQLALSTLLLVATAVLMTALSHSLKGDFGVRAAGVVILPTQNPGGTCSDFDPIRGVRFQDAAAVALPKTPGISSVGWASTPPLGRGNIRQYAVQAGAKVFDRVDFNVTVVSPSYFATLGIPLLEGRGFDAGDGALAAPVAVVDELLARRHLGPSAVGQHLITEDGERVKIVGIVRSGRYRTLQDSPQPVVYLPYAQAHMPCGFLFVRTASDPAAMIPTVVGRLTAIDGGVTITRPTTVDTYLTEALAIDRMTTTLVGVCGVIALLMAMAGVYGVMSDAVLRRTREIGLRVALGAGRPQVVRLVFTEASYLTITGVLAGVGAAVALEQVAKSFVHGLPSLDAFTVSAAPAVLALVVAIAAVPPLRRALAVSPTIALRAE